MPLFGIVRYVFFKRVKNGKRGTGRGGKAAFCHFELFDKAYGDRDDIAFVKNSFAVGGGSTSSALPDIGGLAEEEGEGMEEEVAGEEHSGKLRERWVTWPYCWLIDWLIGRQIGRYSVRMIELIWWSTCGRSLGLSFLLNFTIFLQTVSVIVKEIQKVNHVGVVPQAHGKVRRSYYAN